ncbi:MAG TPA: hypothetical protein VJV22_21520 [Acidobacteriaceae bacterium]|nr:hypothetical protein [Acidobacteriaceae bacterium]
MKFRKEVNAEPQADSSREMRELAEAMSLYRSAMQHVAQKHAAAAWVSPERLAAESRKHARAHRMRLILVPALGAGLAAAVIAPVALHVHHEKAAIAVVAQPAPAQIVASVDDTELMNQIDSDLTQDVPDALAPLDDLSQQGSTNQSTENTNAHQK